MQVFYWFFLALAIQRILELFVAKRNEKWMKKQGALEFGQGHYPFMVGIHLLFFISLFAEVFSFTRGIGPLWKWLFPILVLTQFIRIWALFSLGRFWNTKILVLPNANIVKKGPYLFLKHPNYVVVTVELLIIPLLFNAYYTSIIFSLLNILILSIRIPAEESALRKLTAYEGEFQQSNRFLPKI